MVSDTATRRLFRRAIMSFIAVMKARKVRRAQPELNHLQKMIAEYERLHRPTKRIRKRLTERVHARLRREIETGRKAA